MPFVWLFALLVLLVGNGCTNRERQADSSGATLVAEGYLRKSRRAQPLDKRIALLLGAAHISWRESGQGGVHEQVRQIYNAATAELAVLLMEAPSNATISVREPAAGYCVRLASGNRKQGIWDPRSFSKILLPRASKVETLREVVNPEGFGGILVGIRKVEDPGKWFLPRAGVSAPITVIADFENKSSATCDVTLTLYDPTRRDRALVASRERPLRGGFGAALAYYPNPRWLEYAALIDPARYEDREAIYIVQPYDPGKIPVVLVHGLISIPQMWFPVIAQIEKDPELRGKFQFWTFAYPTGDPVALSALRLREGLRKVYEVYPKTKSMVMVSYSLGGLVGKMQVQTTGDAVWQGIFKDDSARLEAELPPDSLVKRALVFKGNPRIERMVFICTPHLGTPLATGLLGRFGRGIIFAPAQLLRSVGSLAAASIAESIGQRGRFLPNSIWGLSPNSPLLLALYPLPVDAPFHSIIGNRGLDKIPLAKSSDGVVPYWSSHLAGAVSERIVPAQHVTACQNPETVDVLKRILRLHLREVNN